MNYKVEVTSYFKKQAKRLLKKFPSLREELNQLSEKLGTDPEQGTGLGNNCFKIRLAISSKGKGKSGGARLITHIQISKTKVFLLSIYDKSEQSDMTESDLKRILDLIP